MASNSMHNNSVAPKSTLPGAQAKSTAIFWSVVSAVGVFAAFAGYAYLAPATFATSAVIKLEAPAPALSELPEPRRGADQLLAAVMSPQTFKELARLSGSESAPAELQLQNQLKAGLEVSPQDGQTFVFRYQDSDPERAQKACNLVARRAAELVPGVLLKPKSSEPPSRKRKLDELLAFLAEHPELSSQAAKLQERAEKAPEPPETSQPAAAGAKNDPLLRALYTERKNTLAELGKLKKVDPANPYAGGVDAEIRTLSARIREIDAGIEARNKGLTASDNGTPATEQELPPELQRKWLSLLEQLAQEPAPKVEAAGMIGKGVIIREADFPRWPEDPDRQLLLLIGCLVALVVAGLGVTGALVMAKSRSKRTPDPAPQPGADTGPSELAAPEAEASGESALQGTPVPVAPAGVPIAPEPPAPFQDRSSGNALDGTAAMGSAAQGQIVGAVPVRVTSEPDEITRDEHPVRGHASLAHTDNVSDDAAPQTVLGGFGGQPQGRAGQPRGGQAAAMPRPISVRGSEVAAPRSPAVQHQQGGAMIEASGVEVVAEARDTREANVPAAAEQPYRPPARKKTQMLGSPTWANPVAANAATHKPAHSQPDSARGPISENRYSYVSGTQSDGGSDPGLHPAGASAGTGSHALAQYRQSTPLVATQPPPAGWVLDPNLLSEASAQVRGSVHQQQRQGCLVIGVAGFAELAMEKSRLAAGIAVALSQGGQARVLLLEGDFQSPLAHRSLGVEMPIAAGLSQQLQLRRIKGERQEPPWVVLECGATLHVMGEGVIRSPGAILSREYEQCLTDLRGNYDYIIVDGPALTSEVECRALAQLIHGVVLALPRAGMQLPAEVTSVFHGKQFMLSQACLSQGPANG